MRRLATAVTLVTSLAFVPSADAKLAPQITDPKGDAKAAQSSYDIVSVTLDTTKVVTTTVVKGRKIRTTTIKDFVVTMELVGPVDVKPGTSYQLLATSPCDIFFLYSYWAVPDLAPKHSMQFGTCGDQGVTSDNFVVSTLKVSMSGNKIVWTAPMKALPKEIKVGSRFEELEAYTAPTEPTHGYSGVDFAPTTQAKTEASFDYAASDQTYRLGS